MDIGSVVKWGVPLLLAFSSGVGAYIGVLQAIAALRLEFYKEMNRRDLAIEAHGERIKALEEDVRSLADECRSCQRRG